MSGSSAAFPCLAALTGLPALDSVSSLTAALPPILRHHPEHLVAPHGLLQQKAQHVPALFGLHHPRLDGQTARGLVLEDERLQVAEHGLGQGARNRRSRHVEDVRVPALGGQGQALLHAEAVLLVDDGQPQIPECHVAGIQRMGSHQKPDSTRGQIRHQRFPFRLGRIAREQGRAHAGLGQERRQGLVMLGRQDFRGGHQGHLAPGLDDVGRGEHGHHGLAGTHVAHQQAAKLPRHAIGTPRFPLRPRPAPR